MTTLIGEKIVRPFETHPIFASRVLAPTQAPTIAADEPPTIKIQGSADSHYVEAPPPLTFSFTVEWEEDKSQRKSEEERVENPDDPSQFVIVEKIQQATFRNGFTGEQLKLNIAD